MAGYKLTLPTTFTNDALPVFRDDPILPVQGAMMLIDPTHGANPWSSGIPINGSLIPNLASSQLSTLLGSSVSTDVQSKAVIPSTFTGASGKLERTDKGGLHGIVSQSAHVIGTGPVLSLPTKLIKYVLDNKLHDFYFSMWFRVTRFANNYPSGAMFCLNGNGQQTNSYLFNFSAPYSAPSNLPWRPAFTTPPRIGGNESPYGTLGLPKLITSATDGWWTAGAPETTGSNRAIPGDGIIGGTTGTRAGGGLTWGSSASGWEGIDAAGVVGNGNFNPPGALSTVDNNKLASWAFYRSYLEDLSVSGRSYSEVAAIDSVEYARAFAVGGRYGADTYTDPATIA